MLLHLLARYSALGLIFAGFSDNYDSVRSTHKVYKQLAATKRISKRGISCAVDEYFSGDLCCNRCGPGYIKSSDCTKDSKTQCTPCEPGEEYMDHYNSESKCRRCNSCDKEHGMEVEERCTPYSNVKCMCLKGFFCNSSDFCHHCDPCDTCAGDIIVEECTQNKNTVCKKKPEQMTWLVILISVMVIIAIGIAAWMYLKKRVRKQKHQCQSSDGDPEGNANELMPLQYPDIDLSRYISEIAEELILSDVMRYVRKQRMPNPVIDQVLQDNAKECSEQKIQLLLKWYQQHGRRNAYKELITCLKDLGLPTNADRITQKIDRAVAKTENISSSNVESVPQNSALCEL